MHLTIPLLSLSLSETQLWLWLEFPHQEDNSEAMANRWDPAAGASREWLVARLRRWPCLGPVFPIAPAQHLVLFGRSTSWEVCSVTPHRAPTRQPHSFSAVFNYQTPPCPFWPQALCTGSCFCPECLFLAFFLPLISGSTFSYSKSHLKCPISTMTPDSQDLAKSSPSPPSWMPRLMTSRSKCHILEIEMFPLLSGYSSACIHSGDVEHGT